jgi:hypothetical protein
MLRKSAFFPHMSTEVKDFVDCCLACQQKIPKAPDTPHGFTTEAALPWATLHIDYVGPLPPGTRIGAKWLLTTRCGFSKWIEAFPLIAATAEATVVTLIQKFLPGLASHIGSTVTWVNNLNLNYTPMCRNC